MSLKKQIIALLKTQFPGVQLSEARINQIASKVDAKVTTEEEIGPKLTELDELMDFAEIAKQDDRLRSLEAEAKKKTPPPTPNSPATEPEKKDDDTPAWAKALVESNKVLAESLSKLQGEKVLNDRRSIALAKLKETNATQAYIDDVLADLENMNFKDDAHFEEVVGRKVTTAKSLVQAEAESEVGNDKPVASTGTNSKVKQATDKELDAVMENLF